MAVVSSLLFRLVYQKMKSRKWGNDRYVDRGRERERQRERDRERETEAYRRRLL